MKRVKGEREEQQGRNAERVRGAILAYIAGGE